MVNRVALAIGVGAPAVVAVVACDVLVDLGPKATLRDAGDGPTIEAGLDTGAPDTGVPEAGAPESGLSCGLPPVANKPCDECTDQYCCAVSEACGKSARCTQGTAALLDCVYDPVCVGQVDNEYLDAGVVELQNCVVNYCGVCFPGMNCNTLAGCCKDIPDAQAIARQLCIGTVNQLDEMNCKKVLEGTLRQALGSQFCGGPAPDAGGGD
jgi:hypothetical protein